MKVVVSGAVANRVRNAGEAWVRASWVEALTELGHEVTFVEALAARSAEESLAASGWFAEVVAWFDLVDRSHLVVAISPADLEPTEAVREVLGQADVLVDISGTLPIDWLDLVRGERVYVDLDPGFTQVWAAHGLIELGRHHLHATVGTRIGRPGGPGPTGGVDWIGIRQPVVLRRWPTSAVPVDPFRCTTVTSWRPSYGPLEWDGVIHGLKVHEFRRHRALPDLTRARMELALAIDDADAGDRDALLASGWNLSDPRLASGSPDGFRRFVAASSAEWSVAQGAYVGLDTGWFSDRTVRYLASGRPAIVQDTGWTHELPSGSGLLGFHDPESAATAIDSVMSDPQRHGAAARRLAEEFFAPGPALGPLLHRLGVTT